MSHEGPHPEKKDVLGTTQILFFVEPGSPFVDAVEHLNYPDAQIVVHPRQDDLNDWLENLKEEDVPNVIFLSLDFANVGGLDCIEPIKASEKLKDVPVVVLSYFVDTENELESLCLQKGAYAFISATDFPEKVFFTLDTLINS